MAETTENDDKPGKWCSAAMWDAITI